MTSLILALLLAPGVAVSAPHPIVLRHDRDVRASLELAEGFPGTLACEGVGSGTLIAPTWVLTAGHVAQGMSPFSPHVLVDGKRRAVRQVVLHPKGVIDGLRPPEVDLALLELAAPLEGIRPVPLDAGAAAVGDAVVVVGHGDHGFGNGRLQPTDGVRRAATNTLESVEAGRVTIDFDAPPEGTELEGVGGPGDSGGSLYTETSDGWKLVGVSSASTGGRPGSYGVVDLYVRVADFRDWIETTCEERAGEPPLWPRIVDVSGSFPADERGDLTTAFLEVFPLDDPEIARAFGADFRSRDSMRRNPADAFVQRFLELGRLAGPLEPSRLAQLDDNRWVVLAQGSAERWWGLHLRFDVDDGVVKLGDYDLREEAPPRPAVDNDEDD